MFLQERDGELAPEPHGIGKDERAIVVLTYLAGAGASVAYGALLLLVYGLSHSVLILAAGTSMGAAKKLIESKGVTRATEVMRRVAGGVVVLVGVYFAVQAL